MAWGVRGGRRRALARARVRATILGGVHGAVSATWPVPEWTAEISSPTSPNPNEVLAVLTSGERSSWVRERLAATAGGRRRGRARRRAGEARVWL
uniref:Uncharacterized protein n=1 Tax=Oryza sativa subsp. japonica TaxID=39947 RepID=Q9FRG7_ORYSJ|nr:hypothetical protein [Oryza sativa Japonica Group]